MQAQLIQAQNETIRVRDEQDRLKKGAKKGTAMAREIEQKEQEFQRHTTAMAREIESKEQEFGRQQTAMAIEIEQKEQEWQRLETDLSEQVSTLQGQIAYFESKEKISEGMEERIQWMEQENFELKTLLEDK